MIPKKIFFTKGVGLHKNKLISFELALRDAGIEKFNLVPVSSIFPPNCEEVSKNEGLGFLEPGEIVHCVMVRAETNEEKSISASIGVAIPLEKSSYGYISEYHDFEGNEKETSNCAKNLALEMFSTISDSEKKEFSGKKGKIKTKSITQAGRGKKGVWTTAVAVAVFVDYD